MKKLADKKDPFFQPFQNIFRNGGSTPPYPFPSLAATRYGIGRQECYRRAEDVRRMVGRDVFEG